MNHIASVDALRCSGCVDDNESTVALDRYGLANQRVAIRTLNSNLRADRSQRRRIQIVQRVKREGLELVDRRRAQ